MPVTVLAAARLGEGASSVWAQAGIAAAVGTDDSPALHAADTIAAGAGIVDEAVARFVTEEGPARIADLVGYGVPFDRDAQGRFLLSQEAAHSRRRVVHVSGDRTGAAIMKALIAKVRATPSIRVLDGYEADELITADGQVAGVRLVRPAAFGNGSYEFFPACAVVLATGGIGALYAVTTNPGYARGEAIAMAARAGAVIADAEFVQFHPTAINVGADPAPLATEALRGEGATLVNAQGERFMLRIDPRGELGPRDIVARGVFAEIAAGRGAFLDCRDGDRARASRTLSRPSMPIAAQPASTPRANRSRWRRQRTTTWAASRPTPWAARASPAYGPSARWPRRGCTAPTGSPPTRCSRRSCSARAPPTYIRDLDRNAAQSAAR